MWTRTGVMMLSRRGSAMITLRMIDLLLRPVVPGRRGLLAQLRRPPCATQRSPYDDIRKLERVRRFGVPLSAEEKPSRAVQRGTMINGHTSRTSASQAPGAEAAARCSRYARGRRRHRARRAPRGARDRVDQAVRQAAPSRLLKVPTVRHGARAHTAICCAPNPALTTCEPTMISP